MEGRGAGQARVGWQEGEGLAGASPAPGFWLLLASWTVSVPGHLSFFLPLLFLLFPSHFLQIFDIGNTEL